MYSVIDLFAGCGGLSKGFELAGFNIISALDNSNDAIQTFNRNHNKAVGQVVDLKTFNPRLLNIQQPVDLIIGGPPCQGFSIAGKQIIEDERNELYKSFVNFVDYFEPKAFLMENVPNILSIGDGLVREKILQDFRDLGYTINYKVLLASNYGVPQNRKRAFFIGFRGGHEFDFSKLPSQSMIPSKDALGDLPEYTLDDGAICNNDFNSDFLNKIRNKDRSIFNHQITEHKLETIEIISQVPDGGNYKSLPEHLRSTRKVNIAWTRLNSAKPSFTIDTGHRHHFHYKFNRIPTVRESARLQSFSDDFVFVGSKTSQYRQVGNAVPPILAQTIANILKNDLQDT